MREIKFRAWNRTYNWMEDHFYIGAHDGTAYDKPSRTFDTPNIEIDECPDYVLMQYTGLKDANGVEIYEGDIVAQEWIKKDRYDSGEFVYGVIKFVNGCFVEAYKISERQEDFEEIDGENCVVVGNIYQNPELLK